LVEAVRQLLTKSLNSAVPSDVVELCSLRMFVRGARKK
jgi:hypothetical protein